MQESLYKQLNEDIRFTEGLNACMNCGICTAICPAAEFFDYDPRNVVTIVQSGNNKEIKELIESDTIWYCGQCMSCKTRCPRDNCPGLIISVLRKVSQETGAFVKSRMGRQQYLIINTIGANILKYGYCVHPTTVIPENHPEQGTVWKWIYENRDEVYASLRANYNIEGPGALRKISKEALSELNRIFECTGGLSFFEKIESHSRQKAQDLKLNDDDHNPDMEKYIRFIESE